MHRSKYQMGCSIFFIILVASTPFTTAGRLPPQTKSSTSLKRIARQAEGGALDSIFPLLSLAMRVFPLVQAAYSAFSGFGADSGTNSIVEAASSATSNTDRIEAVAPPADPFSWSNLLSMGIRVALAFASSYAGDNVDRIDNISPTQAVLGTVISAMTGSEDPAEVATMAKQANEVIGLVFTLFEALQTSFLS